MWEKAEEYLIKDKYLTSLVRKYSPCKIIPSRKGLYFSDLVESILSQQLSTRVANVIIERVRVGLGNDLYPTNIIGYPEDKFRKHGVSWAKIKYIKDLGKKANRGALIKKSGPDSLVLSKINKLVDEDIIAELTKVKGIGRWTAEMFLMFSLARPDIFPVDDLGIRKAMEKLTGKNMNQGELIIFSQRWVPYRTVASWYIWRLID